MMLDLSPGGGWRPPIVRTVAIRNEGIDEAVAAFESHGAFLASDPEGPRRLRRRARARLLALLEDRFRRTVHAQTPDRNGLEAAVESLANRLEDPYAAAARVFERVVREPVRE